MYFLYFLYLIDKKFTQFFWSECQSIKIIHNLLRRTLLCYLRFYITVQPICCYNKHTRTLQITPHYQLKITKQFHQILPLQEVSAGIVKASVVTFWLIAVEKTACEFSNDGPTFLIQAQGFSDKQQNLDVAA